MEIAAISAEVSFSGRQVEGALRELDELLIVLRCEMVRAVFEHASRNGVNVEAIAD